MDFLGEVSRMSILRHENISLFMGACLEEPNLAVITSDLKGTSLYHNIHLVNDRLSMHSRVNIVRQVAQGMGYLHAKGLVLKKLNSKNVYLEPKVKICLIDYGMVEAKYDRCVH
jgi:kinase suppressor of Ras 2